jgi:hypothetical protein
MGQYHKPVNLDKREFLDPHALGDGLKLYEQAASREGVCAAVCMLLAASNGRGGGDFPDAPGVIGRWVGDRVVWVGDYAEPGDVPGFNAPAIYAACRDVPTDGWTDITPLVARALERTFQFTFAGEGWRHRHEVGDDEPCRYCAPPRHTKRATEAAS